MNRKYLIVISLIIIVLYAQSLKFPHLLFWDNTGYSYTENPIIQNLNSSNIRAMFTQSFDNHYHPFTLISLAIDYTIGQGKAIFFRITNLLLFILIALFIFDFIYKLFKNNFIAFFVSLFFALHPFNVESVLWISERKNLLFMFFLIPSMTYYLKYIDQQKISCLIYSCLFFILSLLSKSQGLPMVFLLFVIDYIRNRAIKKCSITEKTPYIIIALIFLFAMFYFHESQNFERTHPHSFFDYLMSGFRNFFFYIYKTFIPINFSPYYPYPQNPIAVYCFFPILFGIIIWLIFKYLKNNRLFIFGITFYTISIFPLLKFLPIPYGNYIAADRYMILPIVGLAIANWAIIVNNLNKLWIKGYIVFFFTFLFISSYYTLTQWKNSRQFYSYLIKQQPTIVSGWGNRGRVNLIEKKYREAIVDFSKALEIKSDNSNLYVNKGLAYAFLKQFDSAYINFSEAIRYDSSNYRAYSNRSLLLLKLKKPLDALNDITCSIVLNPNFAEGWANKAFIEYKLNHIDQALISIEKAIELDSNNRMFLNLKEQMMKDIP